MPKVSARKRSAAREALEFRKLSLEVEYLSLQVAEHRALETLLPAIMPLIVEAVRQELSKRPSATA